MQTPFEAAFTGLSTLGNARIIIAGSFTISVVSGYQKVIPFNSLKMSNIWVLLHLGQTCCIALSEEVRYVGSSAMSLPPSSPCFSFLNLSVEDLIFVLAAKPGNL